MTNWMTIKWLLSADWQIEVCMTLPSRSELERWKLRALDKLEPDERTDGDCDSLSSCLKPHLFIPWTHFRWRKAYLVPVCRLSKKTAAKEVNDCPENSSVLMVRVVYYGLTAKKSMRQNKISECTFVIECHGFGLFWLKPLKTI